ncbi:GNAT family N-acetyltransferase [Alkalicoccus daliensis]|uniref:Predicted acetyltransferase n=1 Tax=Alkalicoccus daliensis TaxID=745820 RepID=A0A1H0DWQ1_9BACI|nr:GNAT family N-acetyltransferase [Alkalicoccus daliensis]SDN74519.1 Predicted acetyltransferase [Alkalicoccus daliensis]
MNIRRMKAAEAEKALIMSEFAFQYTLSEDERRARLADMNPHETWIAEEDGEILSKAAVLPLHVYMYGLAIPAGGVSGVATWPEHRRKGIVAELLTHSLKEMKEQGQLLSLLYPFSIPFYRKYGWELFADREKITLTREQFPLKESCEGECRRISQDAKIIGPVYDEWASKRNGTIVRTAEWWKKSVFKRKKGIIAAYFREGVCRGYLIYEVKDQHMQIDEIIWLDPDARKGLFSFIRNHDSMAEKVSIITGAHDIFPFLLPDPKAERVLSSYFMARIVDCETLLALVPFQLETNESIILHVSDSICAWNVGTYIISASAGTPARVRFFPLQSEENTISRQLPSKGITLDINNLSAVVMGAQSAEKLWEEQYIEGDEESVRLFTKAVPAKNAFIYDFF